MYIIKEITVENDNYISSSSIDIINGQISIALQRLLETVKCYIKNNHGYKIAESTKIMDIINTAQICEPLVDSILLYKLVNDPHKIHVYERKTVEVKQPNWTWGSSTITQSNFKRIAIFELEEITNVKFNSQNNSANISHNENTEMISIGNGTKIPKIMTISPMCDVINELKNSSSFKMRKIISAQIEPIITQNNYYKPEIESDIEIYGSDIDTYISDSESESESESESNSE